MEWEKKENNYKVPVKSWCDAVEDMAMKQACDLAVHPVVWHHVALMPDCHPGYGMPIGGVIAADNAVIPNAVGVDIGCGMGAVRTSIRVTETRRETLRQVTLEVKKAVPCGEGKAHRDKQKWGNLEKITNFEDRGWYSAHVKKLALQNLGTLGGGNHFIEVQAGDDGRIWLMIHSGSRHLGNVIARFYNNLAVNLNKKWNARTPGKDLAFLPADTPQGQDYIRDMNFALSYAMENRRRIMARFMEAFSSVFVHAQFGTQVNIHHNYAALERHFGKKVWIHRKGATSAKPGEQGIIPGSMGAPSYLVEGLGNPDSFMSCSHGAGRTMGRMAASRNLTPGECDKAMKGIVYDRWNKLKRNKFGRKKLKGLYDLGEAPQAYKDIDAVINAELDLIRPLHKLRPLAVVKG